ncbi:hypothetical protein [Mycoplana sp. MJR14]|jgi:hypothetical protein|uniref:hypothetical protein n=1 Tax=Mycoplana sp. MJR14 TaxID=3032583 RepID=UPI000DD554D6|nr:hypothetical protein [Mycoplana sp. MJR14]MDF1635382.1 hypothetical protein [Mycoplana sp. MJR14]
MTTLVAHYANTNWLGSMFGGFRDGMSMLSAARECADATRERRRPSTSALQTLGIDETAFRQAIKRR